MAALPSRRLLIASTFAAASLLALGLTVLAMRSLPLAVGAWLSIVGLVVLFLEPFVGLVNYLTLLYIRPQDFVPALAGFPIMLILGGGTLALILLHKAMRGRSLRFASAPQNFLVTWFYVAIIVSQLSMLRLRSAVGASLDFVSIAVMYLIIVELVSSPQRFKFTTQVILHLTLVLAVQGLVQHFTGFGFGGQQSYKGRIQAVGIFADPNDLALVISTVLPLTFFIATSARFLITRVYAFAVFGVFMYATWLTQSRGGLLTVGVLAILVFMRKYGRIFGLIAGLFAMVALSLLGPRMNSISTEDASAYGRLEAWVVGLDLFQQAPLFGVGYNEFIEHHFRTAHNSWVLCIAELGLFGLYAWIMLLFVSWKNCRFVARELRQRGQHSLAMYAQALELGLVAYVVGAMFLSRTYHALLFILIGLCAALVRVFVAGSTERYVLVEKRDFVVGFGMTVASVIAFKAFMLVAW